MQLQHKSLLWLIMENQCIEWHCMLWIEMNHSCWKLGHSSNWFQPSMSFEGWVKTLIVCENRSSGNKSVICVSTLLRSTPQKIIEVNYEFTSRFFVFCNLYFVTCLFSCHFEVIKQWYCGYHISLLCLSYFYVECWVNIVDK